MSEPATGRFRVPPSRQPRRELRLVGRHGRPGLGHQSRVGGMTIYESMRKLSPDFFVHSGDTIYADMPLKAERKLPRRHRLEEHRHRGQVEGGRDAGRVPRQPPLQLPRREPAALQCRSADDGAVGRPRGGQQLVLGEAPRQRRALLREERRRAGGLRAARVPRIHAALWRARPADAVCRVASRSGRGSTCSASTCAATAAPTATTGRPGSIPIRPSSAAPRSNG